jgi:hypothetical protein
MKVESKEGASSARHPGSVVTALIGSMGVLLSMGCGAGQVVIVPDYDNEYYRSGDLTRPEIAIVETNDTRNVLKEQIGIARVGMFNKKVPCLLSEPVSGFVTTSLETMLGVDSRSEEVCPVTVRIDALEVGEDIGIFHEGAVSNCRLSFSFPVTADSIMVSSVSAVLEKDASFDATGKLDDLLYESILDCTRQFLRNSYDRVASRLLVDRSRAMSTVDEGLRAEAPQARGVPEPAMDQRPWFAGASLLYHGFAPGQMRDVYGTLLMLGSHWSTWFEGRSGLRAGGYFFGGSGPAPILDPNWTFETAKVRMGGVELDLTYLYRFRPDLRSTWLPYAGAGVNTYVGIDRLELKASNSFAMLDGHAAAVRAAMGVHALLGCHVMVSNEFSTRLAARWTQTGKGSTSAEAHFDSSEEEKVFDQLFYSTLQRPDFNFTGWGVDVELLLHF